MTTLGISSFPRRPGCLTYDVAIVGGATSGSAIAWFLASSPDFKGKVLVIERDPSLSYSATQASNSCMRQQFATEINVKLQAACGAGTQMISPEEIAAKYPFFATDDIKAGSLNTVDEGAFDALGMVRSLRKKAQQHGVDYIHNEVTGIGLKGNRVHSITLKTGEVITVGTVVNAAGTRAAHVSGLAGIDLPIEARRRYTFIFSVDEPLPQDLPLTVDPSGVHMRSYRERDYLVGCPPIGPDVAVDVDDFDYTENIWNKKILPVLRRLIPQFSSAKVTHSWMGHYEFNTFDHNAIIGPHSEIDNLMFCVGFSGHGSQQAPACGRGIAELITYGSFRTLDLSALSYTRIAKNEPLMERAVI
ncbi:DAO domain-containing protein [Fusarium sp. LHS14.1]|nr:DAO domain-containing protein [Fusarium sp. LHS14.1]